jgi:flagellin-like protein|tara:strand:+ start:119 stop:685 length:567 start_codon:yes stop_codon:yes gene_type:complete
MEKRGVSAVIASVLLIMLTVVAVGLIMAFVLPFIENQTEGASDCFDVFGGIEFKETEYNCYINESMTCTADDCKNRTGFSVEITKEGIVGFRVSMISEGSSKAYDIFGNETEETTTLENVRLLGSNFGANGDLDSPGNGEMTTYVVKETYNSAKIAAILENGKSCDFADTVIFNSCIGSGISDSLDEY